MSTFWDSIEKDVKVYGSNKAKASKSVFVNPPEKVKSSFWDSINAEVKVNPNPTLETSYKKAKAEKLIELKETCKVPDGKGGYSDNHHFIIPTGAKRVIGQCSKCKGERWFNNYIDMEFNRTPKTTEQISAEKEAEQDSVEQGESNEKV